MHRKKRRLLFGCFTGYCVLLATILFLRSMGGGSDLTGYPDWKQVLDRINLIPFSSLGEQLRSILGSGSYSRRVALRNLAANGLLFVPMGFFLPALWKKLRRFRGCAAVWLGLILLIEMVQLLTLQGSFDIDDVILNTLGFVAGYGFFMILKCFIREET